MASSRLTRSRAPHQLPPGRHGLARSYVAANQRERMLDAVADVVSFKGYAAMSVEDIVGAAGVSRRTFYDLFKSKDDAFLAAFDSSGNELLARVRAAYEQSVTFAEGVIECLRAFLEFVAAEPHHAELCLVEALAAGPDAIERRNAVMRALAELLHRGAQTVPGANCPPLLTAETVIGGIYEVAYSRVLNGETSDLPKLLPDLAYSVMLPYVGRDSAAEAVRTIAPTAT